MDIKRSDTTNYFVFYGLRPSFYVDLSSLKKNYYRLSKELHPDYHTLADTTKQNDMLQLSAYNNKAYKTLKNGDQRIAYILEILGSNDAKPTVPQSFLMEMMDINEGVMELEFDPDPDKKETLTKEVEKILNSLEDQKAILLQNENIIEQDDPMLREAQDLYYKLQYINRVGANLSKLEA